MKKPSNSDLDWLNNYLRTNYQLDDLIPILHFTLLWNIFESKACGRRANWESIRQFVNQTCFESIKAYESSVHFFCERYLTDAPEAMQRFRNLRLPNHEREFIEKHLIHSNISKDHIKSLLYILLRIRNNLSHGNKCLNDVNPQAELIREANTILRISLDKIK